MDSGRFLFGPSSCHGNMLFLGNNNGDSIFQGTRSLMSMDENSKIRPFFSTSEELYEEYYDDQMPEKKRRLTPEQVHLLEKSFEVENKLEPERKTQLAKKLGLQPRQVAVWFQNRRARWKTKQLERDYDVLKASYDSLRSNYDSIVKENEKLRSEINALNEKLQSKEASGASTNEQTNDAVQAEEAVVVSALQLETKVEDRLSSGSGESAVVDEDGPQLVVDSEDSYFHADDYPGCVGGGQSEEDDGSEDGGSYLSDVFAAPEQPHQEEDGVAFGWMLWS